LLSYLVCITQLSVGVRPLVLLKQFTIAVE